jgi:hypothetical protein
MTPHPSMEKGNRDIGWSASAAFHQRSDLFSAVSIENGC